MLISSFIGTSIVFPLAFNSLTFSPDPPISGYLFKTWFWTSFWYGIGCAMIAIPIFYALHELIIKGEFSYNKIVEGFAAGFMVSLFLFPLIIPYGFILTTINVYWLDRKGLII